MLYCFGGLRTNRQDAPRRRNIAPSRRTQLLVLLTAADQRAPQGCDRKQLDLRATVGRDQPQNPQNLLDQRASKGRDHELRDLRAQ